MISTTAASQSKPARAARFWIASLALIFAGPALAGEFSGEIKVPEGYPERSHFVVSIHSSLLKVGRTHTSIINQKDSNYLPYITITSPGSKVGFRNSDRYTHTVVSHQGPLKGLVLGMAPRSRVLFREIKELGVSEVLCGIHSQMRAWVLSLDTPLFAITNERGKWTLKDLPPPPFELRVWNDVLPGKSIEVKDEKDLKQLSSIEIGSW